MVPRNSTPGGFAYIWQSKWIAIIEIKPERSQIHFLSDVFVAAASLDLKMPIFSVERTRRGLNIFSKTESGEHMATDLIRKIKYKWHLLRNARLPPESFELFPLYPLGSLVLQGNLDKWDMTEAWRKMQRCPWQSPKNWLSKSINACTLWIAGSNRSFNFSIGHTPGKEKLRGDVIPMPYA